MISIAMKKHPNSDAITIVMAGGIILALSFGVRSVFGGIVEPISNDLFGGKVEIFSLSIAIQNLVWGLAQPGFGAIADRYGDRRALWLGFTCYVLGIVVCVMATAPVAQHAGAGLLVGMGISGTAFGVVLAAIGRTAPEDSRNAYLGFASALGSVGQAVLPLAMSWLIDTFEWRTVMIAIAAMLAPMAFCIPLMRTGVRQSSAAVPAVPFANTVSQALCHPSYLLLGAGFFVCGFHLAFITAHFPTYVENFCLSTDMSRQELRAFGLQALALIGLANVFGTLLATYLGTIFPKPYVLSAIYGLRALAIFIFISLPLTPVSIMIFSLAMGVLWLSTVPLTSALVLSMFGPRAMGTLFGLIFLAHQLGSFTGVWLGGAFFDLYANYSAIWNISIVLGVFSSFVHLLVQERAVNLEVPI